MSAVYREIDNDGVVRVILRGPGQGNRYDRSMMANLGAAIELCDVDRAVRVVVLEGEGSDFSAGPDTSWLRLIADFDYAANRVDAQLLSDLLWQIHSLRKPTIVKVQGQVVGSGVGLVAACDIAVSDPTARFSFPEASMGLLPATVGPYVMMAVGQRVCLRYFLTGEHMTAQEALRYGLVTSVSETQTLDDHVLAITNRLLHGGPRTMHAIKQMVRRLSHRALDAQLRRDTVDWTAVQRTTVEGRDGVRAFTQGDPPPWLTPPQPSSPQVTPSVVLGGIPRQYR